MTYYRFAAHLEQLEREAEEFVSLIMEYPEYYQRYIDEIKADSI